MSIEFEGLDELLDSLDDLISMKDVQKGLKKCCALVERSAKKKAPKGAGHLRRSIESRIDGDTGIVFTPLEYAPYIEYGTGLFAENGNGRKDVPWHWQDDKGKWHTTKGIPPHPYMRPALNENREQIIRILKENLLND